VEGIRSNGNPLLRPSEFVFVLFGNFLRGDIFLILRIPEQSSERFVRENYAFVVRILQVAIVKIQMIPDEDVGPIFVFLEVNVGIDGSRDFNPAQALVFIHFQKSPKLIRNFLRSREPAIFSVFPGHIVASPQFSKLRGFRFEFE